MISVLMMVWALAAPEPSAFLKGPWLHTVTATQAQIRWEATSLSPAQVAIDGPGGPRTVEVPAPVGPAPAIVTATVEGLAPGGTWSWKVTQAGSEAAGTLRTPPAGGRPFTFLIYGDNRSDHRAHQAVVEAMDRVHADLWINTGDLVAVGGRPHDWTTFFDIEGAALRQVPMYPVIGNHEVVFGGERLFGRYFGQSEGPFYGAQTWGNVRFVFIDTFVDAHRGTPSARQAAWLLEAVKAAKADPAIDHVLAVTHVAPYSSVPMRRGNAGLRALLAQLEAAGVDALLAGHDHLYERATLDSGLPYLIVGGGGAPLYPTGGAGAREGRTVQVSRSAHSYVRMKVAGPYLSGCAVDLDGLAFDCFTLKGDQKPSTQAAPATRQRKGSPAVPTNESRKH